MDNRWIDRLARGLAASGSRRRVLRIWFTTTALTVFYLATPAESAARQEWTEEEVIRFIRRAANRYHQPRKDMLRVARCESNLDPYARNPAGPYYGLFQFLKSTWKTTPYRDKDIYHPKYNALAAAWMWNEGRRDEWACQ